jgi:regulator of replication initiation timing
MLSRRFLRTMVGWQSTFAHPAEWHQVIATIAQNDTTEQASRQEVPFLAREGFLICNTCPEKRRAIFVDCPPCPALDFTAARLSA